MKKILILISLLLCLSSSAHGAITWAVCKPERIGQIENVSIIRLTECNIDITDKRGWMELDPYGANQMMAIIFFAISENKKISVATNYEKGYNNYNIATSITY